MKSVVVQMLRQYKRWISPVLPVACRYVPTCSEYAIEAVEVHGVAKGCYLAMRRLLRCHPLGGHGIDQVPLVEATHAHCAHTSESKLV